MLVTVEVASLAVPVTNVVVELAVDVTVSVTGTRVCMSALTTGVAGLAPDGANCGDCWDCSVGGGVGEAGGGV
ncbi:MAG TPA: hypothetical protein VGG83_10075 [Trebonia sp.]